MINKITPIFSRFTVILLSIFIFGDLYSNSNSKVSDDYPIVFVSRNHEKNGNILYPQAGLLPGMGPHSRFKKVGGKLMVRETNGQVRALTDYNTKINGIKIYDVQQPCVHWDGNWILFAGVEHPDSNWRIYEINKNGTELKKITFTDREIDLSQFRDAAYRFEKYDDIDPIYLPNSKIVFASTRYPSLSKFKGFNTTNLFIIQNDTGMFRMTTERNGAEKPTIDPVTGKIVYARWWVNTEMPSNQTASGHTRDSSLALSTDIANIWQPVFVKPDGDEINYYAGDPRTRKAMFTYRPRIMRNGDLLGVYSPNTAMTNTGGSNGIRYYKLGLSEFNNIVGVDSTTPLYSSSPPSYGTMQPPYATDPVELPNGRIMFSYATSVEEQDYAIYTSNLNGSGLTKVYDNPGTLELNAEVLLPKQLPPQVTYLPSFDQNNVPPTSDPNTFYQGGLFRFDCINIYSNAPVDVPIDDAPPITRDARIRFFLDFQREDENGEDEPILFSEVDVEYDGKVLEGDIPSNVSMFEQVVDADGNILVNSKGNIAHVSGMNFGIDGSGTKCVGCHVGHTLIEVPINNTLAQFTNLSTSANVAESSFLTDGDDVFNGQKVVDRKAKNENQTVNWISTGSDNEFVELKWELPIDVKEFVLYNIIPNPGNGTDIQVTDCEIFIYLREDEVGHVQSTGPITTDGKSVVIDPMIKMDRAKIIVKDFTGNIRGQHVAGLAEIETISRISVYETTGIIKESNSRPDSYILEQNYPNPFNPETEISFSLPKEEYVSLNVYDSSGKEVANLISGKIDGGKIRIGFNAKSLPSGVYFYRLIAGDFKDTKKMVLLK